MKHYCKNREQARVVGDKIAEREIGQYGFCVEILETRTLKQNSALHKYFELLAIALNEKQLPIQMKFLGKEIEVEWTKEAVKERIWLPPMQAMFNKTHTSRLARREVSDIYDVLNRHFIEKHDIFVAFPEDESRR